jgi:hypothetical protein
MAEKIQDAEDRLLESMFQSESIADNGFSDRVVRQIRRQMWVRRLALPVAMVAGAAIAVKPAAQLFTVGSQIFGSLAAQSLLPQSVVASQLPVMLIVGMGLAIALLTFRLFEE